MECKLDCSKQYGIVLEGGGARGAYQIGAWKALVEAGIQIKGVSGTSVGALNGALICMENLERAEEIWKNITYSQVMSVEDDWMEGIIKHNNENYTMAELIKELLVHLSKGGFDVTPLKNLILEHIDEQKLRSGNPELYIQTFSVTDMKELEIDVREIEEGKMAEMILASAYLPLFKKDKIDGSKLIDAGIFNNVPVDTLMNRGYQDIISIRIYGLGTERKVKLKEGVTVLEIAPRVDLGGLLEFDSKKSCQNMLIGYHDAMRLLYGLGGTIYYIDCELSETECLNYFIQLDFDMDFLKEQDVEEDIGSYRNIFEKAAPTIAKLLKLDKNWNYHTLYLSMLEAASKQLHIQKYKIYTEKQLAEEVVNKWENIENDEHKMPRFLVILLKKLIDKHLQMSSN